MYPHFSALDLCSALSERFQSLSREAEKLRPALGKKPCAKYRKLCAERNRAYTASMAAHDMLDALRKKADPLGWPN